MGKKDTTLDVTFLAVATLGAIAMLPIAVYMAPIGPDEPLTSAWDILIVVVGTVSWLLSSGLALAFAIEKELSWKQLSAGIFIASLMTAAYAGIARFLSGPYPDLTTEVAQLFCTVAPPLVFLSHLFASLFGGLSKRATN